MSNRWGEPIDALDELLASSSMADDAPAAEYVHPFDREDPASLPRDPAAVRQVQQSERDQFWSRLSAEPWAFDFFAAVRRLEALHPELPGFGSSSRCNEDTVRFSQHPSLAFAPCTMPECRPASERAPTRLFVNFLGMLGPNGPLPLHITEHAHLRELHHKDFAFSRFLDVFNHRMVSLFYRAWAASSMPASFDRTPPAALRGDVHYTDRDRILASEKDRYQSYIGAFIGIGMPSMRHRDAVPDIAKLYFAGRIAGQQTGPEGLRAILSFYFGVPVHIEEFAGRYIDLPDRYWTRLGGGPNVNSSPDARAGATLGTQSGGAIVLGSHVYDPQGAFRIHMGPMTYDQFVRFVPGSPSERRLRAWIRMYLGEEFHWEAHITLKASEVPRTSLQRTRVDGVVGSRLGWTSWLITRPQTSDRSDLHVRSDLRVLRS